MKLKRISSDEKIKIMNEILTEAKKAEDEEELFNKLKLSSKYILFDFIKKYIEQ